MNAVSSAAALICVCTVICSILNMASPDSKMQKPARIALAVFFICSLISPVKNAVDGISAALELASVSESNAESAFDYDELVFKQTVQNLAGSLKLMLSDNGYTAKNIAIDAHISSDNSIKLDSIRIYIDEASTADILKIKSIVSENFGLVPSIMSESSNGT